MEIKFVLDSIDLGTIVLPEFQRGYVWSRDQVRGLMQSLYRRYPVGDLLIWSARRDAAVARGEQTGTGETVKLLLDGQQRITSLYGIVKGTPPPFFEDTARAEAFTGLHFNVAEETFEFYRASTMKGDLRWISVTALMRDGLGPFITAFTNGGMATEDVPVYIERLSRLRDIQSVAMHSEEITGEDKTIDVVVDIFNRVNSGGTKLSKGDLALARICAERPSARHELRRLLAKWADAGFAFQLEWLLRCVTVVATGRGRFNALRDVSSDEFATSVKRAEQAIDYVLNLLNTRLGIDHDRVLAGRYGIPAMVRHVAESGGSLPTTAAQNRLLYWYVHSAAWGRYSGSTETMLDRDLDALERNGVDGLIAELQQWRGSLDVRPDDFDTQTMGSRFYPILYLLTRVRDARDFCSGFSLSAHLLGRGSGLEVHHLFPKSRLYEGGFSRSEVNAIGNYAFLTGDCNRRLGKRLPEDYMAELRTAHPGALESQWIPMDPSLWSIDRYRDFIAARRRLLAAEANVLLGQLRDGLLTGEIGAGGDVAPEAQEAEGLQQMSDWVAGLGLARPELLAEIADDESGEILAYADALWRMGLQEERTEPVAYLQEADDEMAARLSALGYRVFESTDQFRWYLERLLGIDLDQDGFIGPTPS